MASWAVNSHDAFTSVNGETRDDEGTIKVKSSSSGFHLAGFVQHSSSDNCGTTVNRLVQHVCVKIELGLFTRGQWCVSQGHIDVRSAPSVVSRNESHEMPLPRSTWSTCLQKKNRSSCGGQKWIWRILIRTFYALKVSNFRHSRR